MAAPARKNATAAPGPDPGQVRGLLSPAPVDGVHAHRRLPPPPHLADRVQHFWSVRWDRRGLPPFRAGTLPHPNVHLVVGHEGGAIHGIATRRFETLLADRGHVFGIKFRPGGFQSFLRAPVSTLRDRRIGIGDVFGEGGRRFEAAVMPAPDGEACIAHAVTMLAEDLPAPAADSLLAGAIVDDIAADVGLVAVAQVQQRRGMTLRRLQRLFQQYVGVGPKWVINRYRLHEAIERLRAGRGVAWPELALQLGYYDQAHFIRDFRRLVGCTPQQFETTVAGEASQHPDGNPRA